MAVRIFRNNDATQVLFTGVQIPAIPCNTHTAEIVDTDFIRIYDHTSPTQARIINKLLWSEIQDKDGNPAGTDAATTLTYVNRQLNTNLATSVYNAGRIDGLFMSIEDNGDTLRVTAGKCLAQVGDKLEEVILSDDFVYPVSNVAANGQDKIFAINVRSNENVVLSEVLGALNGAAIPDDVRNECFLGIVFFNDFYGKFTFAQSMSVSAKNVGSSLYDLAQVINPRIIPTDRPIITKSVNSDMRLGISSGRIFAFGSNLITGTDNYPNIYSHQSNTDITYLQIAEPNGQGLWQINQLGQMQNFAGDNIWTKYDDKSGVLQDVPADHWVLMPVTMSCGQIQQGPILAIPTVYASQHVIPDANFQINQESEAVNALQTYEFPNLTLETSAIVGVIAMRQDATSLADTDKVKFYSGDAQYLQASGISRAMSAIAEIKAQYKGTWDAATNTPDISAGSFINGDWFVVNVAGSYNSVDYVVNDEIRYNGSEWERIPYAGVLIEYDSSQILLNSNAAVYADGAQGLPDPLGSESGWYFTNDAAGKKINWYFVGTQNVGYEITKSSLKNGYARVVMTKTTGDIFMNVYTTPQGDGSDIFWYRSEYTYSGADFSGVTAGQEVLIYWGEEPNVHPTLTRIELTYDNDASTVSPAALDTDSILSVALSTNSAAAVGDNEFVVKELGYKNGLYVQTYLLESSLDTNTIDPNAYKDLTGQTIDFTLDDTSTSIMLDNGYAYGVNTIKAIADADGTIHIISKHGNLSLFHSLDHTQVKIDNVSAQGGLTDVVNALNELFTVGAFQSVVIADPFSTMVADVSGVNTTMSVLGTYGIDPIGPDVYGSSSSGSLNGYKSTETIDQAGEYFTFDIRNEGQIGFGLVHSQASYDAGHYSGNSTYADPTNFGTFNSAHGGFQFSHWFHPTPNGSWTNYGANTGYVQGEAWYNSNTHFEGRDEWLAGNPIKIKVGINENGFITISSLADDGVTWKLHARTSYSVPQGAEFHLGIKTGDTTVRVYTLPKVHLLEPAAPTMYFRYVESPDGVFNYPVFATTEEAEYYDQNHDGTTGTGTYSTIVFPDDPTFTTWYIPTTGYTNDGSVAPSGQTFESNPINWTEITTLTNADLVPSAFSDQTITVDELSAVNIQVHPQGASWSTSIIDNDNSGLLLDNTSFHVYGTAPEVTGDNVANPSDIYTIDIVRTNSYGSSTGTLTIVVNNLTAPVNAISGFNHVSGTTAMIDSDTMDDGSVVHVNNTVADGERFVIEKAYVEANILPSLNAANDMYIIGLSNQPETFDTLELADFDAAIVWEYETASSHTFKFYRDGVVQQNIVINSITQAFYDYAIEVNGTSAWLIACNVNSIMNEPSPADGGNFSHTYEATSIEDTAPVTIHMATLNTSGDISTTDLTTLTTPPAPTGNLTTWSKAIDFSGGSEHLISPYPNPVSLPLQMNAEAYITAPPATTGDTSNDVYAKPWATAIVFKYDGNATNQHIWNQGEGAGSTDDNIYLRLSATGYLYFGWGRDGALNECEILYLGFSTNINHWHGIYIGYNGTRLSGADATAANLAAAFDIRWVSTNSGTPWTVSSYNYSTATNWTNGSTGGRMDRTIGGHFTIGGKGSNRNFIGKVASMVVTTLRRNVAMPDQVEIETMITDPIKWLQDYKDGQTYRTSTGLVDVTGFNMTSNGSQSARTSAYSTQVWLMGDGTGDSFANQIRNQVYPTENVYTQINFNNMVSNDIENVNINGLS